MNRVELKKNNLLYKFGILDKRILIAETVNDKDISINQFIENVLDHCTYSEINNIKDQNNDKKLHFRDLKECKLLYINENKFNYLTLKEFDNSIPSVVNKNKENKEIKEIKEIKLKKKEIPMSFFWDGFNFPIIANLNIINEYSGTISLELTEFNKVCSGVLTFKINQIGTWSVICPDNQNTSEINQKSFSATGNVYFLDDGRIKGDGIDLKKNKVNFFTNNKIIYE